MQNMNWNDPNLIAACSRAMANDPLCHALAQSIEQREKLAGIFIGMTLHRNAAQLKVTAIDTQPSAAAIWRNLHTPNKRSWHKQIYLQWQLIRSGCAGELQRHQAAFSAMEKSHQKLVTQADRALAILFVNASQRGQGLASQLLRPALEEFDQQGLSCVLDTFNPANVPLYQHFGFKIIGETRFSNTLSNIEMLRL